MNIRLEVLMGLPASGKTTFAENEKKKNPLKTYILDMDSIRNTLYYKKDLDIFCCVKEGMRRVTGNTDKIIVDGLFLTNQHLKEVIVAVAEYYDKVKVVIHRWDDDRETCVKNDGGRRELKSTNTILNAKYEDVDIEWLNSNIKDWNCEINNVVNHKVQLKEDWIRFFKAIEFYEKDGKLRSAKWATGGSYGNCWDSSFSSISAENPLEFDIFDQLLEKSCPNITFLHYKKLRKECVSIEESYEPEYYGGGTNYMNWVCDLQKLYNGLKELKYNI